MVPAGVLRLFHTMCRGMGDSFRRHEEINATAGLDCSLQNQDIRTWIFSGTLAFAQSGENVIAASRSLNITSILMRSWVLWTARAKSLEEELGDDFWQIVNYKRKPHPAFAEVPWLEDHNRFDVDSVYHDLRLPVLDSHGMIAKHVFPFRWTVMSGFTLMLSPHLASKQATILEGRNRSEEADDKPCRKSL